MLSRLIHNLAMAAALVALVAGIWQDWALLATLKRAGISYVGFFFLGAVLALAVRAAGRRGDEENEEPAAVDG